MLSATIKNAGVDAAPASTVAFYLSADDVLDPADTLLCTETVSAGPDAGAAGPDGGGPGLAGGASVVVSRACTLPATKLGTFRVLAKVDHLDTAFETDENNNVLASSTSFTIQRPDFNLVASMVSFTPFTTSVGRDVTVAVTVANPGSEATPPYALRVYVSTDKTVTMSDPQLCFYDRPSLAAASGVQFQIVCRVPTTPPGNYWLGVILDPDNELPETSETDNVATETLNQLTIQ
jgi:subtilase family serine protease